MLVRGGRKAHETRRRKILNRRRPRRRTEVLPQTLLEREIGSLEATTNRIRFYNQRTYTELVNLSFEQRKIPLLPGEKIRIHFLHIVPSYWPAWRSFYYACRADERMEGKIILLDCAGTRLQNPQSLGARELLEKMRVPHTEYMDYDPAHEKPHLIFYHVPHEVYYRYFRKVAPDLTKASGIRALYCTYGIEYDAARNKEQVNIQHYHNNAHSLAWRSFVMHEDIREGYFRFCPTGGEHVVAAGHPKFDNYAVHSQKDLPREMAEKQRGRRLIVFQVHHPGNNDCRYKYRDHHLPVREIIEILRWLVEQEKIFCVITLHPIFEFLPIQMGIVSAEELEQLFENIRKSPSTFLFEGDYQALLQMADAFISGPSSLLLEMAFLNKPVLYLSDEIHALKPFVEEIFTSFYHGRGYGHGLADVKTFCARMENDDDPLSNKRQQIWEKYFSSYEGQIGQRMKENIITTLAHKITHDAGVRTDDK